MLANHQLEKVSSHSSVPVHKYYVIVFDAGNQYAVKSRFWRESAEIKSRKNGPTYNILAVNKNATWMVVMS